MSKIQGLLSGLLFLFLIVSLNSCAVVVVDKKDNGKHKGWTKNTNNPHHPQSTNPGKGKSRSGKKK